MTPVNRQKTVLTICAHNDDQIIGAGGTLAKYSQQGWTVRTIIFSHGENSHPHLKPEEVIKMRSQETIESDKILGGHGAICLGVKDTQFGSDCAQRDIIQELKKLILREKPDLVFTHSKDDIHPDHRTVYRYVKELARLNVLRCPIFTFDVWTPFGLFHASAPKLYVDISATFDVKVKAFLAHRSQMVTLFNLILSVYLRALFNGWRMRKKYGEVFYALQ